jgi:serine/threonine-protein kinase
VAESLQQLATCEQWKGNDARATELLNKVKTMFADSVSAESPQVASVLRGLGVFASRRQDNAEARSRLEEALSLQRKLLGPHNPQVAHCEYELAVVLQRTGEVDAAARLYEHVRDVYRRVFGEQYEGIAFVLLSEAVMLLGSDKASEAETALREVESRLLEVHPPDHWVIQNVRSVRGRALFKLGRLQEAESLLVESCRMLREKLTPEHPNAVNAVQYLLALYEATGRLEKAAECRALLPGQKAAEDSPVTR